MLKIAALALLTLSFAACSSAQKKAPDSAAKPAASTSVNGVTVTDKVAPKAPLAGEVHCRNKSDERVLKVANKEKGCDLEYTKMGKTASAASSRNGTAYCSKAMNKIVDKLKASGFTCE